MEKGTIPIGHAITNINVAKLQHVQALPMQYILSKTSVRFLSISKIHSAFFACAKKIFLLFTTREIGSGQ